MRRGRNKATTRQVESQASVSANEERRERMGRIKRRSGIKGADFQSGRRIISTLERVFPTSRLERSRGQKKKGGRNWKEGQWRG